MSRGMGTHPPRTWDVRGVSNHRLRHGIRLDMVSKQALCILLECFVVGHHFTNNSVREIKIWFHHLGSLQSDEPLKNDIWLPILLCTLFKVSPFCGATGNPPF